MDESFRLRGQVRALRLKLLIKAENEKVNLPTNATKIPENAQKIPTNAMKMLPKFLPKLRLYKKQSFSEFNTMKLNKEQSTFRPCGVCGTSLVAGSF
ncbi:hypothetical protein HK099_002742, partial [Clydaea vesicula]